MSRSARPSSLQVADRDARGTAPSRAGTSRRPPQSRPPAAPSRRRCGKTFSSGCPQEPSDTLEAKSVAALRMHREFLVSEAIPSSAHVDDQRALELGDVNCVAVARIEL